MSPFVDDPALLVSFREGKREALERVYRAYVRSVDRFLHFLVHGSGSSELRQASAVGDLLQEAFVRAFSADARRSYDGLRDYGPYLMTIARNCFVDALRARGHEVLKAPEDLPPVSD